MYHSGISGDICISFTPLPPGRYNGCDIVTLCCELEKHLRGSLNTTLQAYARDRKRIYHVSMTS